MKLCVLKETAKIIGKGLWTIVMVLGLAVGMVLGIFCSAAVFLHLIDGKIGPELMWMVYLGYAIWVGVAIYIVYECYKEAEIKCELQEVRKSIKANRIRLYKEIDELNKKKKS